MADVLGRMAHEIVEFVLGYDELTEKEDARKHAEKKEWDKLKRLSDRTYHNSVVEEAIFESAKNGNGKLAAAIALEKNDPCLVIHALDSMYAAAYQKEMLSRKAYQLVEPGFDYADLIADVRKKSQLHEDVIKNLNQYGPELHIFNRLAAAERGGTTDSRASTILRDSIESTQDAEEWEKLQKEYSHANKRYGNVTEVAMAFAAFGPATLAREQVENLAACGAWDTLVWIARFTQSSENALLVIDATRKAERYDALYKIATYDMNSKSGWSIPAVKEEAGKAIASIVTNKTVEEVFTGNTIQINRGDDAKALLSFGSLPVAKRMVSRIARANEETFKAMTDGGAMEAIRYSRPENEQGPLVEHMHLAANWRKATVMSREKADAWLGENQFKKRAEMEPYLNTLRNFEHAEKKRAENEAKKTVKTAG